MNGPDDMGRGHGSGGEGERRQPGSRGDEEPPGVERLLALSDGVVAIALTLLVLGLKIPPLSGDRTSATQLWDYLFQHRDVFSAYFVSFYVIALFWLIHHRVFRSVRGHSEGLAWVNFAFLLFITLMPFTSDLLGKYAENPLAVDIFALNLLLASVSTQAVLVFGRRKKLLVPNSEVAERIGWARMGAATVVLGASCAIAWASPSVAKETWILLVILPRFFQRRIESPRSAAPA